MLRCMGQEVAHGRPHARPTGGSGGRVEPGLNRRAAWIARHDAFDPKLTHGVKARQQLTYIGRRGNATVVALPNGYLAGCGGISFQALARNRQSDPSRTKTAKKVPDT
jgi:hypothetical protein